MKSEEHMDEEDCMKAGRRFEKRIDYGVECLKTLTKAEDYINSLIWTNLNVRLLH